MTMNSQYSIVNTILKQINTQASTAQNDNLRYIIRNIANKYGKFRCGSSRAVIVLPDDGIVIKVPYMSAGYMQNQIEYDNSNLEHYTDVLECHDFAGQSNYIIVCPYYQPIIERYDELVDNIIDGIDVTVSDIMEIYTDAYIDMHFEGVDNHLVKHIMDDLSNMDMDLSAEAAIYEIDSETVGSAVFDLFEEYELGWYDCDISNFGITDEKKVIMLDNGIRSHSDLLINNNCLDNVTYKTLIGA